MSNKTWASGVLYKPPSRHGEVGCVSSLMLRLPLIVLALLSSAATSWAWSQPPAQPTEAELRASVRTISKDQRKPEQVRYVSVEPSVSNGPTASKRAARFMLRDPVARRIYEVTTDLGNGSVLEWLRVDDVEPIITQADRDTAASVVWRHDGFRRSLERRGVDSASVYFDVWPSQIPREGFRFRSVRVVAFVKGWKGARDHTRPVEGLVCTVNLDARRVFEFYDKDAGPVLDELPDAWSEVDARKRAVMATSGAVTSRIRRDAKSNTLHWRDLDVVPRFYPKEGLVLYHVGSQIDSSRTPRLQRISLAELVEIHGSESQYWYWRHPLLVGELGLGMHVMDQRTGIDVPASSVRLPVSQIEPDGRVRTVKNAIACYEEHNALVIRSTMRLAHREIVQEYRLLPTGEVLASVSIGGIEAIQAVEDSSVTWDNASSQMRGALVAPHRFAPFRQYQACFRIEWADAIRHTVSEVDLRPAGDQDPYNVVLEQDEFDLLRETEAQRNADPAAQRFWRITARGNKSKPGYASYRLESDRSDPSIIHGQHVLNTKAAFLKHDLWVTRAHENELWPAGPYPAQTTGGAGLPEYVRNNESIAGTAVVTWAVVRRTHLPQRNGGVVMSPLTLSVRLMPDGLSVPRSLQPMR